jgi:peptidoglycan/LPS O-acetylase OafA/YrhL
MSASTASTKAGSSTTGRGGSLGYIRAFDGLRGVAILMVMMVHAGYGKYVYGRVGLDIFFTISGFLITALLLHEYRTRNGVSFKRFYTKRARRILPALVLMIYLSLLYGLLVGRAADFRAGFASLPFVSLFTANWFEIVRSATDAYPFAHTWSMSVEEQFYALWPLLLVVIAFRLGRPSWLLPICIAGCAAALLSRLVIVALGQPGLDLITRLDVGTDTNADHILIGCALALLLTRASDQTKENVRRVVRVAIWPALAFFVYIVFVDQWLVMPWAYSFRYPVSQSLIALMSMVIVGHLFLMTSSPMSKALARQPLLYIGEVSLGFYLFHVPLFAIAREWIVPYDRLLGLLIVLLATMALATATFFTIERPIRDGKGVLAIPWRKASAWRPSPAIAAACIAVLGVLPVLAAIGRGRI